METTACFPSVDKQHPVQKGGMSPLERRHILEWRLNILPKEFLEIPKEFLEIPKLLSAWVLPRKKWTPVSSPSSGRTPEQMGHAGDLTSLFAYCSVHTGVHAHTHLTAAPHRSRLSSQPPTSLACFLALPPIPHRCLQFF